jgi:hypothetical protein
MVDLSCYRKGSLDFYDAVLLTGAHEEKAVRKVENARQIKAKNLVVAGLPCLDDLHRQKQECFSTKEDNIRTTVLVAPSWGAKGCFTEYGTSFIKTLSFAGYNVIIRIHPHSNIFEPESVKKWQLETKNLENVTWDSNLCGTQAMSQADILVSDTSSIRFDFVFLYNKPVITLNIPEESREIYESAYMEKTWADTMSEKIGSVMSLENIVNIDNVIKETVEKYPENKLESLREGIVANFEKSSSVIVDYLLNKASILSLTFEEREARDELEKVKMQLVGLQLEIQKLKHSISGKTT